MINMLIIKHKFNIKINVPNATQERLSHINHIFSTNGQRDTTCNYIRHSNPIQNMRPQAGGALRYLIYSNLTF